MGSTPTIGTEYTVQFRRAPRVRQRPTGRLTPRVLFFTFTFLFLLSSSFFIPAPAYAQETSDLLGRVNALRASRGIAGYSYNGALAAAAQSQAQWMVESASISHTRPDGSGPRTRAAAAGYPSAQVSENIYGGTNATASDAWTFWVNSGIHYAGLISTNYNEIGVGAARGGWGATYVLVFGNSGGASLAAAPAASGSGNAARSGSGAAAAPPSYVIGIDAAGNIQHMVQPGDTLGDIALLYGYTWDDLPFMMSLNGMDNVRDLVPGSIFLVPSSAGTFTPTPDDRTPTPSHTPTGIPATITPFVVPTSTPPMVTLGAVIAVAVVPAATEGLSAALLEQTVIFTPSLPQAQPTAIASPSVPPATTAVAANAAPATWLIVALGVQALIVVGAGVEFLRRSGRRGRQNGRRS